MKQRGSGDQGSAASGDSRASRQMVPSCVVEVLDAIHDLLIVVDREWHFVYLNRQALQRAGKPWDDLQGQTIWGTDAALFGPTAEAFYRRALAEQIATHFEMDGAPEGGVYEVWAYPCPEGVAIHGRDITPRHHVEQALRETETLFRTFMDNSPALAWMKDSEFRFLYFNHPTEQVARERGMEFRGRTDFDLWPAEIAAPIRAHDQLVLTEGRPLQLIERTIDTEGNDRYWQVCKFPFTDLHGRRLVGGVAVEITEQRTTTQRLQALSRRLLEVQEQERRALARELHDEVGHLLTAIHLRLESVKQEVAGKARQGLEQAQTAVRDLMAQVRELTLQLRPSILDELGLLSALAWHFGRFAQQTGIQVHFKRPEGDLTLPPAVATAAFRIIQEALTNVARHAQVQSATVRVGREGETLRVEIRDLGRGFAAAASHASAGLSGMQERAALLGGRLMLESQVAKGTTVTAELPIQWEPEQ